MRLFPILCAILGVPVGVLLVILTGGTTNYNTYFDVRVTVGESLFVGQVQSWCVGGDCNDPTRFDQRSSQAVNTVVIQSGETLLDFDIPADFSMADPDKGYFLTYSVLQENGLVWSGTLGKDQDGIKIRNVRAVTFMLFRETWPALPPANPYRA